MAKLRRALTGLGRVLSGLVLLPVKLPLIGLEAILERLDARFVEKARRRIEEELRRHGRVDFPSRQVTRPDGRVRTMTRCGTSMVRLARILEARNPGWKISVYAGPPPFLTLDADE